MYYQTCNLAKSAELRDFHLKLQLSAAQKAKWCSILSLSQKTDCKYENLSILYCCKLDVSRIFRSKFHELRKDVIKKELFGPVAAYTFVIEFQKRGLPHVHMLLILKDKYKLVSTYQFDGIISAELPDKEAYPHLSFDETEDKSQEGLYIDFLNSVTPTGMPPHRLLLKENSPILMLRNINPSKGQYNGTRLICRHFTPNIIIAEISFRSMWALLSESPSEIIISISSGDWSKTSSLPWSTMRVKFDLYHFELRTGVGFNVLLPRFWYSVVKKESQPGEDDLRRIITDSC